jgi:hypothetical protein
MAKIQAVFWDTPMSGQDLHIIAPGVNVPGQNPSGRLGDILGIIDDTPPPDNHKTATTIPADRHITVKFFIESSVGPTPPGITVFDNGGIAIGASNTLTFFNVRAEATDSSGVFATKPRIRVQIHKALASSGPKIWLTPNPLSIHRGSDGQVLSLFAEFDDGTVGDITELPPLQWDLVNASDSSKLEVDVWGHLTGKTDGAKVEVRATLPATWGGLTATAFVEVLPPWETATTQKPLEAHLVNGKAANKDKVPNFLFIPEGFTDRGQFVDTVGKIVRSMRTDDKSSPFDLLQDDVNYWFAWIPSPSNEDGTSVLHELGTFPRSGGRLYGVNLPTNSPTPGSVLADERNSTLGLSVGGRLNLEKQASAVEISWYPRRTQRAHLDKFLAVLKDADDHSANPPKIGVTWSAGKDRGFVIALVAGAHYAGTRTGPPSELIAPALDSAQEIELNVATAFAHRMAHVPYKVPTTPALNGRMVVTHEVCHSLGLGDEYTEIGASTRRIPVNSPKLPRLNLQDQASLSIASGLDGALLKWLWPRVDRAAEMTDKPDGPDGSGQFTVPVKTGQEQAFDAAHTDVQLRSRNLAPMTQSNLFSVVSKAPGKLVVKLKKALPKGADITLFKSGDLAIAPVLSPDDGLPLTLVHPKVIAHITKFHQPMNAPKQPTPARTCDTQPNDDRAIQQATNFPTEVKVPDPHTNWEAVGVYEGGAGFMCGVYHASGACVMRQAIPNPEAPEESQRVLRFCPVCRYILVDQLGPTKHAQLEHWFRRRYPIPT